MYGLFENEPAPMMATSTIVVGEGGAGAMAIVMDDGRILRFQIQLCVYGDRGPDGWRLSSLYLEPEGNMSVLLTNS